jgi:hypothetical protein
MTVLNSTGTDTNYTIYTGGKCTDFPNDIQFTEDDGDTLIYHWSRTFNATTEVFWFKVTDNLNLTSVDVFIYYGKIGQANTNDFDNTFIFGDPFNNSTLNTVKWNTTGNPTYTINNSSHYLEVTDINDGWGTGTGLHSNVTVTLPSSYKIEDPYGNVNGYMHYIYSPLTSNIHRITLNIHHTSWGVADYGIASTLLGDYWGLDKSYTVACGVGGNFDYGQAKTAGGTITRYFTITKMSGTITVKESGVNRVVEANAEVTDRLHIIIEKLVGYAFGTVRQGAFMIRKYVTSEPSVIDIGAEEEGASAPTNSSCIIVNIESGNNVYPPDTFYVFRAVVLDPDLDIQNITVAFYDGATWGNFTFHADTDTWTRDSGLNIIVLDDTACVNSTVGNNTIADFHVRFREEILEANLVDIYMQSFDSGDREDSFEIINNDYFNIVKGIDLIEYSPNTLLFFISIIILILSIFSFRFGVLLGAVGFLFSMVVLLPNIIDPTVDAVISTFMTWTMILNVIFLLGSFVYRRKQV